jgi:hypothetical protein
MIGSARASGRLGTELRELEDAAAGFVLAWGLCGRFEMECIAPRLARGVGKVPQRKSRSSPIWVRGVSMAGLSYALLLPFWEPLVIVLERLEPLS